MSNLFYRDVKYLFEVVITVWMFATSVVYPVERVGGRLGRCSAAQSDDRDHRRRIVTCSVWQLPPPVRLRRAVVASIAALLVAGWMFHRAEFTFAENI